MLVDPTAQLRFGQQGEPAFDQIKPGAAGGSEMQMKAGGGAAANA
jgi:hypothetical protein